MTVQPVEPTLDGAVEALKDAYKAYGEHPREDELFLINTIIMTYLGQPLSCAKITEALAYCCDIQRRRQLRPGLIYAGHEVMPEDDFYDDAQAEYEANDEANIYRVIREAVKEK